MGIMVSLFVEVDNKKCEITFIAEKNINVNLLIKNYKIQKKDYK